MDNSNFDSFDFNFDDFFSTTWTPKDWIGYIQRSDKDIAEFAEAYAANRKYTGLEEICNANGYSLKPDTDADENDFEQNSEPWTILNHPIYIISSGIIKFANQKIESLMELCQMSSLAIWQVAKVMMEVSQNLTLAVNSTDLGELALAKWQYKKSLISLNYALKQIEKIQGYPHGETRSIKDELFTAIFDLRQMCLDLSNEQ